MTRITARWMAMVMLIAGSAVGADYPGVGRAPTDAELRAWDIDVRPDFTGLPAGQGSVAEGEAIWEQGCASCHGDFGDANHVFTPLVGNTTPEDIERGRVASLQAGGSYRTTFTKVASVSTLWDYIHRAMPWDRPKSLSVNQVYAVLAYLLHLADIVPSDFLLSQDSIVAVQARMPNRDGMTQEHGLWKVDGRPDTHNTACMQDCLEQPVELSSSLPEHARGSHGDLSKQMRAFGPVRGIALAATDPASTAVTPPATSAGEAAPEVMRLLSSSGCLGCHALDARQVGPGFAEVAARYRERPDAAAYLATRIRGGSSGVWGPVPMPPFAQLPAATVETLSRWIAGGAPR